MYSMRVGFGGKCMSGNVVLTTVPQNFSKLAATYPHSAAMNSVLWAPFLPRLT